MRSFKFFVTTFVLTFFYANLFYAATDKYRCMWRADPSTTMVVGWNQISGERTVLYYDTQNKGGNPLNYKHSKKPDRVIEAKGMKNHFVRLEGLLPNTVYYFLIADSEGCSKAMSFQTAPDQSIDRLSIVAGGDSRNFREARRNANLMVSKLRPHVVMFAGDMTGGDSGKEWQQWFNDWQLTIAPDGRLTPILAARGNHESANTSITNLFDVPSEDVYYSMTFGGDLLRTYTLNSMIPSGGKQKDWLENDLIAHQHIRWKIAQYHHSMVPHTREKADNWEMYKNWASVFYENQVNLVVESDAHVVKTTYPIRPSKALGSDQGFMRDDSNGTVYVGEGCWGAPLRANNDEKKWTRNSGSFNQFKLIFVDQEQIEVRTIMVDDAKNVNSVNAKNRFFLPQNLNVWSPSNGPVLIIKRKKMIAAVDPDADPKVSELQSKEVPGKTPPKKKPTLKKLYVDPVSNTIKVRYELKDEGEVEMSLLNKNMQRVKRYTYTHVNGGIFLEPFDMSGIPNGTFTLILKKKGKLIGQYQVVKR